MKRSLISLSLTLALALNLSGCTSTATTPAEPNKTSVDIVNVSPTEPTGEKPNTPTTPVIQNPVPKTPSALDPKAPEIKQVLPAQVEVPDESKKLDLPQGPISLRVGDMLPEFMLTDLKGNSTSASKIITKHKLTLINFWTTT